MGINCSNLEKDEKSDEDNAPAKATKTYTRSPTSHSHMMRPFQQSPSSTSCSSGSFIDHRDDIETSRIMIDAQHKIIGRRLAVPNANPIILEQSTIDKASATSVCPSFDTEDDYHRERNLIRGREQALAFDHRLKRAASKKECKVNRIIEKLRAKDKDEIYGKAGRKQGHNGQMHPSFPGDHFLSNVDLIEETQLYRVTKMMPKGAHLHIHFNCCLKPEFLLNLAKHQPRMFIRSNVPLCLEMSDERHAFERCEIQFSLRAEGEEDMGDIFKPDYRPGQDMPFQDFLDRFPSKEKGKPEEWLREKLVFSAKEAHHVHQTSFGAWEKFNGRTRMMKGLFNYEEAFRQYTQAVLKDFVDDNIQYAEIRPNFMESNAIRASDGTIGAGFQPNKRTMELIMEEYHKFQARARETEGQQAPFAGLKVIYCTPRSSSNVQVAEALDECFDFKKRWPEWIAGFDLVGEEGRGRPLVQFVPELLKFRAKCVEANLDIPFLFHCGETLEMGSETDSNILDALLLDSKRIGHGFSLARHPYIMERMKERNVCLEVCPISNEVLGLTPRINGHSMYNLLANNVHCTISSDNGTIFRSTLSHDFYQVMVGKEDMTLHGWRQLIEWSLQHACMEDGLRETAQKMWLERWDQFLDLVIEKYGKVLDEVPTGSPQHDEDVVGQERYQRET